MAKVLKRMTALLTAVSMFVCCAAAVYSAPKSTNEDVIYESHEDGNIYISEDKYLYNFTGENPGVSICGYVGDETELSFPFMINGRDVSAIDKGSFENDTRIVSVSFPNSIKAIGEKSFNGCTSLKKVSFSPGVSQFYKVFCDCPSLTDITFPQGVVTILESFMRCDALSHIKFARSVSKIDENSFSDCVSLKKIEWVGSMTKLNDAFNGCTALETVTIPDGTLIIDGAFDGCTSLDKIIFPDSLLYVTGGFSDCSSLKNVELPAKVLFVKNSFNNCNKLSKLKINKATGIDDTSFQHCPRLIIDRGNHIPWQLLGWIALTVLMALTGYAVFRKLTSLSEELTGKKNRPTGLKR